MGNSEWMNNITILRYDTKKVSYVRFPDRTWMFCSKKITKEINRLFYVPKGFKEDLSLENLEKLDEIPVELIKEGGRLFEIVSNNGKEKILFKDYVNFIDKITPSCHKSESKDILNFLTGFSIPSSNLSH